MRILIVSTDYDTRAIFAAVLRRSGYDVRELDDPDRVVDEAHDCAIAITDYPTLTRAGDTVTQLLRRTDETHAIGILNATTHVFPHEIEAATAAGVDATIVLPAHPEQVIAAVRDLLTAADRVGGKGRGATPGGAAPASSR